MEIQVALASDENYLRYMETVILSIVLSRAATTKLRFHVFCDRISDASKTELKRLCSKHDTELELYDSDIGRYSDLPEGGKHISNVTYFRLEMADRMPKYDKVIYLDCDTLVCTDLASLYSRNITDYDFAAVEDLGYQQQKRVEPDNYPVDSFYVNAGVLLINLKRWRDLNMQGRYLSFARANRDSISIGDQDIINYVSNGHILALSPVNNVQDSFYRFSAKRDPWYNGGGGIENAARHPGIIHYTSKYKPWNTFSMPRAKEWLKVYRTLLKELQITNDSILPLHWRWRISLPIFFIRGFRYFACWFVFPGRRWWYRWMLNEIEYKLIADLRRRQ